MLYYISIKIQEVIMKKILSVLVIAVMMVSCLALCVNAENAITSPDQLALDGTVNKLTADITGNAQILDGTQKLVIDLNGYTWEAPSGVVLTIGNGTVEIYDSSPNKTGFIKSNDNDAISMSNGSLYIKDVIVEANGGGMDAIFVGGGKLVAENCVLYANKAGIDADNNSEAVSAEAFADITVIGGTFAVHSAPGDRNCAIELRASGAQGPKIVLKGDIKFANNVIMVRNDFSAAIADRITADGATVAFGDAQAVAGRDNYASHTVTYTYEAPETPAEPENPDSADAFVIVAMAIAAISGAVITKKVR